MSDPRWRPILDGRYAGASARRDLRGQVIDAIRDITHALRVPIDLGPDRPPIDSINLADGSAGTAVFFAYLARACPSLPALGDAGDWQNVAMEHLHHALQGIAHIPMTAGLLSGITGVSWAMLHVEESLRDLAPAGESIDDLADTEVTADIDHALLDIVSTPPWRGEYDLVSGLVGLGVYALERLPDPAARRCLTEIVARLDELAQRDAQGITWRTPPEHLPPDKRQDWPEGIYDLGVAHGIPGVISLLAESAAAGIAPDRARELLDGAVAWLLGRSLTMDEGGGFASAHIPGIPPRPARSAWCYGDPSVAAVLQQAAIHTGDAIWAAQAHQLALGVAGRARDQTGVVDVGLCHGGAGLLHILNRLYQTLGDPLLREAILSWTAWTLDARAEDDTESVARFRALTYQRGRSVWVAERGFLNGAAGVGLALLATVTEVSPAWDRALRLSSRSLSGRGRTP